jgi:ubiquinone/menaquinone biosynthesis C-methylase UbiE
MATKDQIQKLYSSRASYYESMFVDFLGWGRELAAFLRRGGYLHHDSQVLDAGCGTGIITRSLYQLAHEKNHTGANFHAFDLTENMLEIFRHWIVEQGAEHIELAQADVLEIEALPAHWKEYDLIVTSAMLEYVPREKVPNALTNLRKLLREDGLLLIFLTRRNLITRMIAGTWWKTNTYKETEIRKFFQDAGFTRVDLKEFSPRWSRFIQVFEARK